MGTKLVRDILFHGLSPKFWNKWSPYSKYISYYEGTTLHVHENKQLRK